MDASGVLTVQAFAIGPDRVHLLRGLLVTFAAAFAIKFVVLAALSAPIENRMGRFLRALFDGLTLGSLSQPPLHASEGYIAFAAIVAYLIGLSLLPSAGWLNIRVAAKELNPEAVADYGSVHRRVASTAASFAYEKQPSRSRP